MLLAAKPWSLFSCFSSSKFPFDSRKSFGGASYHSSKYSFVVALLEMAEEKIDKPGWTSQLEDDRDEDTRRVDTALRYIRCSISSRVWKLLH